MQCRIPTPFLDLDAIPRKSSRAMYAKKQKQSVVCLFTTPYLDRARGPGVPCAGVPCAPLVVLASAEPKREKGGGERRKKPSACQE